MSENRIIMHIDVNSAFLSWQAVYNLQSGEKVDLREIPSAVGGNQADRHGIILAKSTPAKKYGVQTGEVIWQAKQKCPELVIVPPNYYAIDVIREKYGNTAVMRAVFADYEFAPMTGGSGAEDYPVMGSIL